MTGRIEIIGYIYWPNNVPCAYSYSLTPHDINNMQGDDNKIARRDIQAWLDTHAGDFSEIIDFAANIDGAAYGWSDPNSEMTYFDCMYGAEDEDIATLERTP